MTRRSLFVLPAALPLLAEESPRIFLFESEEAEVKLVADPEHADTYFPTVRVKREYEADEIILTVFYKASLRVDGQPVGALLSASSILPYVGLGTMAGGNEVRVFSRPAFVRLKLLKSVAAFDINTPSANDVKPSAEPNSPRRNEVTDGSESFDV